jgi:hypothetical protein
MDIKPFKNALIIAIVAGCFGVLGAILQGIFSQPVTYGELLGFFNKKLPVGTIVSSIVTPRDFVELAGDSGDFNTSRATWVPADGRDVSGSKYAKNVSSIIPDMRGLFIRGLNYTERNRIREDQWIDPEGMNRVAGDYQNDAIISHKHRISTRTADTGMGGSHLPFKGGGHPGEWWSEDSPNSSSETRPKNIALYY